MLRISLMTAAALAILGASLLNPTPAHAITMPMPAGLATNISTVNSVQDVAYVCRRVWRCGRYGCGWRRACWWTRGYPYLRYPYWRKHHWPYWRGYYW